MTGAPLQGGSETLPDARAEPRIGRIYYPQLDGLRLVAFALVYAYHGGFEPISQWIGTLLMMTVGPLADRLGSPFFPQYAARSLARIGNNGWIGVHLFFVLSGFLIATLLLREEARFGRIDLRAFWVRRILRIWPLYYLIVAVGFFGLPLVQGQIGTPSHVALLQTHLPAFLAFLGNWSMIAHGPAGGNELVVLWSVCVEEQFYLFCPLLIAFVPRRVRVTVIVLLMGAGVATRIAVARAELGWPAIQANTACQLDTLLGGVLLAIVLHRFPPGDRARRWVGRLGWLAGVGLLAVLGCKSLQRAEPAWAAVSFAAIWAVSAGLIAWAVIGSGWWSRLLSVPAIVWLGRISYGLYMYHELSFWAWVRYGRWVTWVSPGDAQLLGVVARVGLSVGLAAVSFYGFERPFLRLKGQWTRVPSRPV